MRNIFAFHQSIIFGPSEDKFFPVEILSFSGSWMLMVLTLKYHIHLGEKNSPTLYSLFPSYGANLNLKTFNQSDRVKV